MKGCVAHSECGTPRSCSTLAAVWPGTSGSRPSVSPSSSVKGVTPPPRLRGFPTRGGLGRAGRAGRRGHARHQGPAHTPEQAGAGGLPPEPPEHPEPRAQRHRPAVTTPEPRHARPSAHAVPVCSRDTQSEPHKRRRTHVALRPPLLFPRLAPQTAAPEAAETLPPTRPPPASRAPSRDSPAPEAPARSAVRGRRDESSGRGATSQGPRGPCGRHCCEEGDQTAPEAVQWGGGQKNVYRVPARERQCKLVSTPRRRPRREGGRVTKPPPGTRAPGQRL